MKFGYLKIILILLLTIMSRGLIAQEEIPEPKKKLTHELGINCSYILSQLVGFTPDSFNKSPYLVTYRIGLGNWGLHAGIGGSYKFSEFNEPGFADTRSSQKYSIDLRVGLDYRVKISKRFSGIFGLDFIKKSIVSGDIDDSGFDKIEVLNQYHAYGFGPKAGIEFWLGEHIFVSTEAMFYLLYGSIDNGRSFKNFPELNDNVVHLNEIELVTILPASIFLKYQF